jgi:hypothetical protein
MCRRECKEQLRHNPPPTQPTSPAKCRVPHLHSSLLYNLVSSALEAIVGSRNSTPYRGCEQNWLATSITTSTMEATDDVTHGLGPSRHAPQPGPSTRRPLTLPCNTHQTLAKASPDLPVNYHKQPPTPRIRRRM